MKITDLQIFQRLEKNEVIRVHAFGASNTQRYLPGAHWFDYVEMGFKNHFGGSCGQFINAGISGNTTVDLLERFERDLAIYQPHLVILTIGGNDCNPAKNISPEMFRSNLKLLLEKIAALGAETLLQTYYACDLERMDPERAPKMVANMQIIREVAQETGTLLNDNDARWAALRDSDIATYRLLMLNAMHVNPTGNMVIGLDLMRLFGLPLIEEYRERCMSGLIAQALLDKVQNR